MKHNYTYRSARIVVLLLVVVPCVGCDQATKKMAVDRLSGIEAISYFGDTLRLQYVENPGGFLSLGSNLTPAARFGILVVFNAVLLSGLAYAAIAPSRISRANLFAFSLILAGGIGNLIDRVFNDGLVTDFMNIGIGPLRTGIFNVADVAISTGAFMMAISVIRSTESQRPDRAALAEN